MHPNVLVLLAAYNGENWLKEQVKSIYSQEEVEVTLAISVDLSSDNTSSLVDTLKDSYPTLYKLPNQGVLGSAAKNFFHLLREVELQPFDYIALSDQDDIWHATKLKNAIVMISQHHTHAYSSNVTAFWQDGKQILIDKAQAQTNHDFMFESAGPGCTFVLSKKLAVELQSYLRNNVLQTQEIFLHDWFIYAFARSKGYQWYIDSYPSMMYRQHANNVIGANRGLKPMIARLIKLGQGWYRQQILLIAAAVGYENRWPINSFVRLNLFDRFKLALHAHQFRRRLRDQVAFALYVLFLAKK